MPRTYQDKAASSETPGTTTNASKTTIFTYTPSTPVCAGPVSVSVTGHTANMAVVATYRKVVSIKRSGGALSIVGAPAPLLGSQRDGGALLWGDVEFAASGGDLLVQATGAGGTTITWWTTIEADFGNAP